MAHRHTEETDRKRKKKEKKKVRDLGAIYINYSLHLFT